MARLTSQLEGMEALQRAIVRAPELVQFEAEKAVAVTSFAVSRRAQTFVPVVSGALKRAITATSRGTNGRVGVARGEVGAGGADPVRYWKIVEFGSVRNTAHPYFRPATEAETNDYLERIRKIGTTLERDFSTSRLL